MADEQWIRVKTVFKEAIQRSGAERAAFLDQACKDDPELRAEVEELLETDSDTGEFLERPVLAGAPLPHAGEESLEFSIGPYRIKRVISRGGMGIVYEALQEKPRRTVAVKVMQEGFATRDALRRFEYESEILARLNHPHIAQIIEAGTYRKEGEGTDPAGPGVPYLVMEYVEDAKPITNFVRQGELPTRDRIELFLQVCEAVHHGHSKGVIHRDLKPSNILVDGQGQVKVIDFGVARAASRETVDAPVQTEVGQLIGTLRYMSPEQCKADPHDLDIRSDVYALDVVLYEMLLGTLPYDLERAVMHEAIRVIQEEPPRKPGTLNRSFRGDLETILLKALEKDRRHRYQTVLDFSKDLDRYLKGEVILAKPAGMTLRLAKWVKRNPVVSTALAVSALSLAAFFLYVLLWYNPRIRAERDKAQTVNRFLVEMFQAPDPTEEGIDVKVVDILDRAAARVEQAFHDQPDVKYDLQSTLGNTFLNLGRLASAEEQYRRAERILIDHGGHATRDLLAIRANLAASLREQRKFAEAETLSRELIPICESALGPDHDITLDMREGLATIYFYQQRLPEAAALLEETHAIRCRVFGEEHLETLENRNIHTRVLREQGKYEEAEQIIREVLHAHQRILGEEHMRTLNDMESLGILLMHLGRYEEAESLQRELWKIQHRVLGENHHHTLTAMKNLAALLESVGRYEEAEALAREVLDREGRARGEDQLHYVDNLERLAAILMSQDKLKEGEELLRQALQKRLDLQSPDCMEILENERLLASLLKQQGRYRESEELNRKILDKQNEALGEAHPLTLITMNNLANVLGRQEKLEEAEAMHCATLEKRREIFGPRHPTAMESQYNLARILKKRKKYEEAEPLSREVVEFRNAWLGPEHLDTLHAEANLASLLALQAEYAEAEGLLRKILKIRRQALGVENLYTRATLQYLSAVLHGQGKMEEAEPVYLELVEIYTSLKGLQHGETQAEIRRLIKFYEDWGKEEEAGKWRH